MRSANFGALVLGCTSYGARPQARAVNLSLTILDEVKVCELAGWLAGWLGWTQNFDGRTDGRTRGLADARAGGRTKNGRTNGRTVDGRWTDGGRTVDGRPDEKSGMYENMKI